ncbi:MAG TPA: Lrp/AsnC family transcriptional regulator [Lichenihabitans sp.]|jgi:Lrp/AsnC family transcriptional regulator|nr:Lrp/AsnC family transcriptional regulator [Lichenihabitans sp.]
MLDRFDRRILDLLQADADLPVMTIAERVSLSASACSRRIARLKAEGYVARQVAVLDRARMGLPTTVFVTVRTARHSTAWIDAFRKAVTEIPEIVEVHRLTGNLDYILKIVLPNVEHYDVIYKQLLGRIEVFDMSAYISMETVKAGTAVPTGYG